MSERRRGLGRGLGALIPSAPTGERPVDVFFGDQRHGAGDRAGEGFTGNTVTAHAGHGSGAPSEARVVDPGVGDRAVPTDVESPGPTGPGHLGSGEGQDVDEAPHDPADDPGATETDAADAADAAADGAATLMPVPGARFAEVPLQQVRANPRQPRRTFDADALAELVHSVREVGVLQPVVVRQVGTDAGGPTYELVMGERRWRACQEAGLDRVPAIVRETAEDDLLRDALLENLHRADLNPLEEAAAYQQLLDDFGCTHDDLAQRIGRSRPQITNTLRLLRLPPLVQRRVAAGVLSAGHARALLGLDDPAAMERLAQRIVAEGLSVRATEEAVAVGATGPDEEPAARRRPRAGERHVALDDLAGRLSDRLDTRVRIALGRRKGTLTVDFASVEDLDRILATMVPGEGRVLGHEQSQA